MFIKKWWVFREEESGGEGGTGAGGVGAGIGGTDGGGSAEGGESGGTGGSTGGNGEGTGATGTGTGGTQAWPDDWRTRISTDEKHSKTLSRFASPKALYESYTALRQKLDSGELKAQTTYPEKGTDEEKGAWRKANGIPETAEGYAALFKNGTVIGADDVVSKNFLSFAHNANMRPEHVEGMLSWYKGINDHMESQRQESDATLLQSTEDSLRSEWGGEYRRNINMIKGLVESMPKDVQPLFIGARLADGRAMINTPEVARWLLETAMTVNPVGAFVPGAGANAASAIEDEISSIEKFMRTNRQEYNNDEKKQARLRELYTARERMKK